MLQAIENLSSYMQIEDTEKNGVKLSKNSLKPAKLKNKLIVSVIAIIIFFFSFSSIKACVFCANILGRKIGSAVCLQFLKSAPNSFNPVKVLANT